jgi:hypothetical protein
MVQLMFWLINFLGENLCLGDRRQIVEKQSVPLQDVGSVSKEIKESVFKDRIGRLSMESAGPGGIGHLYMESVGPGGIGHLSMESVGPGGIGHLSMESVGPGGRLSKESRFSYQGNVDVVPTGTGVSFYGNKNCFLTGKGVSFFGKEGEGLQKAPQVLLMTVQGLLVLWVTV